MHGMLGFVISLLLVLELIPLMIDGGKEKNARKTHKDNDN
jgi:hypothetical protein